MFGDSERDPNEAIDPPDNTGGGGRAVLDPMDAEATAIDPPDNTGGGTKIDPPDNTGGGT